MKKKRIELNQKLFLNKEKITSLNEQDSLNVFGGGSPNGSIGCQSVFQCNATMNKNCGEGRLTNIMWVCGGATIIHQNSVKANVSVAAGVCITNGGHQVTSRYHIND